MRLLQCALGWVVVSLAAACGSNSSSTLTPGTEGGPCLAGNVCGLGLTCLSSLCVNAGRTDVGVDAFVPTDSNVAADVVQPPIDRGIVTDAPVGDSVVVTNDAVVQTCDVFNQSCNGGNACYYYDGAMTCRPMIVDDGGAPGTQGAACRNINECAAGFSCIMWSGRAGQCQQYCEVGSATRGCSVGVCTHPSSWSAFPNLGLCNPQ